MRGVFVALVFLCTCFVAACGNDDKPAAGDKPAAADKPAAGDKPVPGDKPAAGAQAPTPAAAPPAAPENPLSVGMKAKMSGGANTFDVEILALYGKLALVKFRRDQVAKGTALETWVDATGLEPKGIPQQLPAGDTCRFSAGQQVSCPYLTDRRRYPGRVTEVHGKMANVRYDDDGSMVWNFCNECKTR